MTTVLILAGHCNSGEQHWQSKWATHYSNCVRVEQDDWETPDCRDWFERLEAKVSQYNGDVVLAAHSLGCLLTAYWADRTQFRIKGALLVAPPDPSGLAFPKGVKEFAPAVSQPFSFPSVVVASSNDVYGSFEYAQRCADNWGSQMINVGNKGHINSETGLGLWDDGWALLKPWLR